MKILLAINTETVFDKVYMSEVVEILKNAGMEIIISGEDLGIYGCKVYSSILPTKPLFTFHLDKRSYEEYAYSLGYLNEKVLHQDVIQLNEIVHQENIELVICYDRPAALLVANLNNIASWVMVNQGMYRNYYFSWKVMAGFNKVCSTYSYPQQLSLAKFYATAKRRIGLGGANTSVFDDKDTVSRIGTLKLDEISFVPENKICIYLDGIHKHNVEKILKEAFVGANVSVQVFGSINNEKVENVTFQKDIDLEPSLHACYVIHSGSEYMTHYLLSNGIAQFVVSDHSCIRATNASMVNRCHIGMRIFEEEMDVKRLYEGYRKMLGDSLYRECSIHLSKDAKNYGTLKELIDFAFIDLIYENKA